MELDQTRTFEPKMIIPARDRNSSDTLPRVLYAFLDGAGFVQRAPYQVDSLGLVTAVTHFVSPKSGTLSLTTKNLLQTYLGVTFRHGGKPWVGDVEMSTWKMFMQHVADSRHGGSTRVDQIERSKTI